MTSCDPLRAQARAQSRLTGLLSPLVKAQAESRTHPVTVFWGASSARARDAVRMARAAKSDFTWTFGEFLDSLAEWGWGDNSGNVLGGEKIAGTRLLSFQV